MSVEAMKTGAVDFLTKPVRDQALLDAVTAAIELDMAHRAASRAVEDHVQRFTTLTPRPSVLRGVAHGRLDKCIAFELGISEVTVREHLSRAARAYREGGVDIGNVHGLISRARADGHLDE